MRFLSPEEVAHLASEIDPAIERLCCWGLPGVVSAGQSLFGRQTTEGDGALRSAVEVAESPSTDGVLGRRRPRPAEEWYRCRG